VLERFGDAAVVRVDELMEQRRREQRRRVILHPDGPSGHQALYANAPVPPWKGFEMGLSNTVQTQSNNPSASSRRMHLVRRFIHSDDELFTAVKRVQQVRYPRMSVTPTGYRPALRS